MKRESGSRSILTSGGRRAWRWVQMAVWLVGVGVVAALILAPDVGLHLLWNVLIPVAPALLVFLPGVWRNVCPVASTALFARKRKRSRRRRLSVVWQGRAALIGVGLLFILVPLRHPLFDLDAMASAVFLLTAGVLALSAGFLFEWKSAWCSGICPVHGVEKLYGQRPLLTVPNAHCVSCERCVAVCPDSTAAIQPLTARKSAPSKLAGLLLIGGFPGFIWGWFQVPDYTIFPGIATTLNTYAWPMLGMFVTLLPFLGLLAVLEKRHHRSIILAFAGAAVTCYYWYRLPALVGFGPFPGDGMLVDLRGVLPEWAPAVSRVLTVALFAWWFMRRQSVRASWGRRPLFADAVAAANP